MLDERRESMAKFDAGMENMVDMYIYETTSLLEQLDHILMQTESENSFSEDEINEIFRIMHTIKGSSAMMGLENMSHLAHSVEDLFYIIREQHPVITDMGRLYELVFTASDLLRAEIDIITDDTPPTDFSDHMAKIRAYAAELSAAKDEVPAAQAPSVSAPAADGTMKVRVRFEENTPLIGMRALVLINNIREMLQL